MATCVSCTTYRLPKPDRAKPVLEVTVSEKETAEEVEAEEAEAEESSFDAEGAPAPEAAPIPVEGGSGVGLARKSARRARVVMPPAAGDGDQALEESESSEPENSPLSVVDQILERLDLGNIAFNTPDIMGLDEVYQVELLLSPSEDSASLAESITGDGPVETVEGVRVAPEMEATLVGAGFEIKAATPARQAVGRLQRTRWAWDVSPKSKGSKNLHLTLSARILVEGKDTPYVVKTFSRTIKVEVSFWGSVLAFLGNNWQWLWTTLIVPLVMWLWKRKKAQTNS